MSDLCRLIWCGLIGLFRPRCALEAENLKKKKLVACNYVDALKTIGQIRTQLCCVTYAQFIWVEICKSATCFVSRAGVFGGSRNPHPEELHDEGFRK